MCSCPLNVVMGLFVSFSMWADVWAKWGLETSNFESGSNTAQHGVNSAAFGAGYDPSNQKTVLRSVVRWPVKGNLLFNSFVHIY